MHLFREILLELDTPTPLGSRDWLRPADADVSSTAAKRRMAGCLFRFGSAVATDAVGQLFPAEVTATLETLGLIARNRDTFKSGPYRLVPHLGLLLFCHHVSRHGRFYYGPDSLALSRVLDPRGGRVLDLCAGVGAQSLACARTAESVTAVEIEPLAEPVFHVNAAVNGLTGKVEFLSGDLYEPVAGRRFDFICANPPFLPVPAGVGFPLWAGGGADGLDLVLKVLAGLPEFLTPGGSCRIIGSALGDRQGPRLDSVAQLALALGLHIDVSCYTYEPLDERTLASFAATATACSAGADAREQYRAHFARLDATHLFYFVLRATL